MTLTKERKGTDPRSLLGGCEKHFIDYVNKLEEEL